MTSAELKDGIDGVRDQLVSLRDALAEADDAVVSEMSLDDDSAIALREIADVASDFEAMLTEETPRAKANGGRR